MARTWNAADGPELQKLRIEKGMTQKDIVDGLPRGESFPRSPDTIASYERREDHPRRREPPPQVLEALATIFGFLGAGALLDELERRFTSNAPGLEATEPADLRWLPMEEYLEQLEAVLTDPVVAFNAGTLYASVGKADVLRTALGRFYEASPPDHRPRITGVVLLRLSDTLVTAMEERGELQPGFGVALRGNLEQLGAMLAAHEIPLEIRETDRLPAFHGFLFGDHLFRGTWQVGPSGALDVHTMLEHRTLQRDPEAHAELHLTMQPFFREPARLGLSLGEYAIFGSGPMAVRGLRDPKDVDVIVTPEAWARLVALYPDRVEPHEHGLSRIQIGNVEILDGWYPEVDSVDALVRHADVVLGVPFVQLDGVRRWKEAYDREKDRPDIELIDAYFKRRNLPAMRRHAAARRPSAWRPELGPALRALRGERPQREIAMKSGVDIKALSAYERGLQEPRADTLVYLAKVLGFADGPRLLEALEARPETQRVPGLPTHTKVRQLLRAMTHPLHDGRLLVVAAGTADVTQMLLARAYEGAATGRRKPVIGGVVLLCLSEDTIARYDAGGELEPGFGAELSRNVASIRDVLTRSGASFQVQTTDEIPAFHGFCLGDHAFVGRWAMTEHGTWHVRTPIEHITRQSGLWPELWTFADTVEPCRL